MPAIIARRARQVFFIKNEECLGEILGHGDFDGYPFSVGDRIVFEDGTTARIEPEPKHRFHIWSEGVPTTVREILDACRAVGADLPPGASDDWSLDRFLDALARLPKPRRPLFRQRWIRK